MSNPMRVPPHLKSLQNYWRESNPVYLIRQQLGLGRPMFAVWLGLDVTTVRLAEQGWYGRLPARLVRALDEAGFDGEDIARRYVSWRTAYQAAIRGAMAARGARCSSEGDDADPLEALDLLTPSERALRGVRSRSMKGAVAR